MMESFGYAELCGGYDDNEDVPSAAEATPDPRASDVVAPPGSVAPPPADESPAAAVAVEFQITDVLVREAGDDDGDSDDEHDGVPEGYAVVHVFGTDESGASVCVHVRNVRFSAMVRIPPRWTAPSYVAAMREVLAAMFRDDDIVCVPARRVYAVGFRPEAKRTLGGTRVVNRSYDFLEVKTPSLHTLRRIKSSFRTTTYGNRGADEDWYTDLLRKVDRQMGERSDADVILRDREIFTVHHTRVPLTLAFTQSIGSGMSKWVALGGTATRTSSRISTCVRDFVATQEDFIPLPDKSDVAPALGVSFDIETYSPNTPRSVEDFNILFARWSSGSTADPTRGDFELSREISATARALAAWLVAVSGTQPTSCWDAEWGHTRTSWSPVDLRALVERLWPGTLRDSDSDDDSDNAGDDGPENGLENETRVDSAEDRMRRWRALPGWSDAFFDLLPAEPWVPECGNRLFSEPHRPSNYVINVGMSYYTATGKGVEADEVLCLGQTVPADLEDSVDLVCFQSEAALLDAFRDRVVGEAGYPAQRGTDVESLVGYNIFGFDVNYLARRAILINYFHRCCRREGWEKRVVSAWERRSKQVEEYERLDEEHASHKENRKKQREIVRQIADLLGVEARYRKPDLPPLYKCLSLYTSPEEVLEAARYFGSQGPTRFFNMHRLVGEEASLRVIRLESAAFGQNLLRRVDLRGRWFLDMWLSIKNNISYKFRSYKLDYVAKQLLGQSKADLPYETMFSHWESGDRSKRREVARYCIQDCRLVVHLLQSLATIPEMVEQSRLCHVSVHELITRGQQIKVLSQLIVEMEARGMVLNTVKIDNPPWYEGATVIKPTPGWHREWTVTLDFASLYPSIMQAFTLSTETVVLDRRSQKVVDRYVARGLLRTNVIVVDRSTGEKVMFVRNPNAMIVDLLRKLLSARRRVKKEMKKFPKDSFDYVIRNARQKALKVACNSVYGFFGTKNGAGIWQISAAVTSKGRELIEQTRAAAHHQLHQGRVHSGEWAVCNGVHSEVIYGDTDSVMVKLHNVEVTPTGAARAWRIGDLLANHISGTVFGPYESIVLELEDLSSPFLLWPHTKKRYIKRCTEHVPDNPTTWADLGMGLTKKGIETSRRDNAALVPRIMNSLLDIMMPLDKPPKTEREVHGDCLNELAHQLDRIERDDLPLEEYIVSKSLRATYKSKTINQKFVADLIRDRIVAGKIYRPPPKSGDRIPMVCIVRPAGTPQYQCFDDPPWVEKHPKTCVVDRRYYLYNQLLNPLAKRQKIKGKPIVYYTGLLSTICRPEVYAMVAESAKNISGQIGSMRYKTQKITSFFQRAGKEVPEIQCGALAWLQRTREAAAGAGRRENKPGATGPAKRSNDGGGARRKSAKRSKKNGSLTMDRFTFRKGSSHATTR